jgi:hypothetical protein
MPSSQTNQYLFLEVKVWGWLMFDASSALHKTRGFHVVFQEGKAMSFDGNVDTLIGGHLHQKTPSCHLRFETTHFGLGHDRNGKGNLVSLRRCSGI